MQDTTVTLTHIFYFLPTSITFRSKERMLEVMQDETKQNVYVRAGISLASETKSVNAFLRSMKDVVDVHKTPTTYTIVKKPEFKALAEKDSGNWNTNYKKLLITIAKKLILSADGYSDVVGLKKTTEKDRIKEVAEKYLNVDTQVATWLFEYAKLLES
jgi:hypothetical protein